MTLSASIPRSLVRQIAWAAIHDRFEEGGFNQSGIGRLRATRGMEEFQETKTCVHVAAAQ